MFLLLFCFIIINFVFFPILLEKFERIVAFDASYLSYRRRFVRLQNDSVKRLFYDERNDCVDAVTRCSSNRDCFIECALDKGEFYCDPTSRLCLPKRDRLAAIDEHHDDNADSSTTERQTLKKCFPYKGVMAVLRGDEQTRRASWKCLSIFPTLIDDRGNKLPGVCEGVNSKFNVNLKSHYPRIEDCVCSHDRTLVTFGGRTFGNIKSFYDIPRCVLHPHLYV